MSIFSRIKDAIFGQDEKQAAPQTSAPSAPSAPNAPRPSTPSPQAQQTSGIPASPANAKWDRPVDVDQVLSGLAAKSDQKLNWQTSIVDLMKLINVDSSLANRKELAKELGYTGDTADSASMNIWLHKRVMQELEKNGGKVPASLV
jgi:3-oxoacyl-ACP reductase-like protein